MGGQGVTSPVNWQQYGAGHGDFWAKLVPYLVQWAAWGLVWIVGALAHNMWSEPTVLPWVTAGLALVSAGLTYGTWQAVSARPSLQIHATLSVAAAALWLTVATIAGPSSHPTLDLWLLGGPAVVLSWNFRRLTGKRDRPNSEGKEDGLTKAVRGLKSAKVIELSGNKVVAQLEAASGHSADDLVNSRAKLAAQLEVGANRVRVAPDPDNHSTATAVIVPDDLLKASQPWPGLSAPGGCITEPLVPGLYEDGLPAHLWLAGDPSVGRNTVHLMVMGMSGSGKSHGAKILLAEVLSRRNACLLIADGAKGLQAIGDIAPHAAWAEVTKAGGMAMVDQLMAVITARTNHLASEGLDEWTPESTLPFAVVWLEEAPLLIRDSETMIDVAQTARSAGMSLVLSMQRPSMTNVPVEVRQQFGATLCFGVSKIDDALFVLDEDVVTRGADPSVWKANKPGYFYLTGPGIPEDRFTTPARTFGRANAELAAAMEECRAYRPDGLDPVTGKAAGKPYANRPRFGLDERGKTIVLSPAKGAAAAAFAAAKRELAGDELDGELADEVAGDELADAADQLDQDDEPTAVRPGIRRGSDEHLDDDDELDNPEPDLDDVDVDAPLPDPLSDVAFGATRPTPAEARDLLWQRLAEIHASGATSVGPKDVGEPFFEAVRVRSWVSQAMSQMAMLGQLQETDKPGVYLFPPDFETTRAA